MDNATPLKSIKKPVNKFFLIANIILLLITVVIGVYYLKIYIPSTTKPKASCTPNTIYCRRDDPSVCPNIISSLAGYRCDGNGNSMGCSGYDACARIVYPGQSCSGLSGYDSNGSTPANFVGCCNRENCWCYPPGGSGTVSCVDNSSGVSCGWNPDGCGSPPQEDTPTPTATPFVTNTPTPTRTPTPTATRTPTPSVTPIVSSTPSVTPFISNTPTVTPLVSNTPGPSATPIPVLCGTKDCDNATNPCRSGYNCVQAHDGSNYCTSPDFTVACKANPSYNTCCTAPGAPTATPTEIILAKTTISPTVTLLKTGMVKSFMFLIPALIMLIGLIL